MSLILLGTKCFPYSYPLPTETHCPRCAHLVRYSYVRTRRWLTYFFIPVLPLSTTNELVCPVCAYSIKLSAAEARFARRGELKLTTEN